VSHVAPGSRVVLRRGRPAARRKTHGAGTARGPRWRPAVRV